MGHSLATPGFVLGCRICTFPSVLSIAKLLPKSVVVFCECFRGCLRVAKSLCHPGHVFMKVSCPFAELHASGRPEDHGHPLGGLSAVPDSEDLQIPLAP